MTSKAWNRVLMLRWPLLAGAVFYTGRFLFVRPTAASAELAAACGAAWLFFSRKKMRQIDSPRPR